MKKTSLTVLAALAVFLTAGVLAGGADGAPAAAPEKVSVPLSSPDKPCSIVVDVYLGSITVKGTQGREVVVEAVGRDQALKPTRDRETGVRFDPEIEEAVRESREAVRKVQEKDEAKKAGMKKLSLPTGLGLEIREENNRVRIEADSMKRAVDLTLLVPVNSSLNLECYAGGDIVVENVNGEFDIENYAGSVILKSVSGAAVVETYGGEIKADFRQVAADKPMSFSTYARDIDITFPANFKASVRIKTENGEVYSDFDVALDKTTSQMKVEDRRKEGGRFKVTFDDSIRGAINGGGSEYAFNSYQGNIYIRKAK